MFGALSALLQLDLGSIAGEAIWFALLAVLLGPVFAFPCLPLGYLVSYAMCRRNRRFVWEWMIAGIITSGVTCFALYTGEPAFWSLFLLCGSLGGYFMWRRL